MHKPAAILIAGPTASGKSGVALELARQVGGVIVNADSKQVYRDLRVLSARPSTADEAEAPHRMYGHIDAAVNYSVAMFLADAQMALAETARENLVPIFVGGTGLYFKALTMGLSKVPPLPANVRDEVRARLAEQGPQALHAELAQRDPAGAARLKPADRARIARALEVILATGRPLDEWNRDNSKPLLEPSNAVRIFLEPDRKALYARIDKRLDKMIADGALDEVGALARRHLDPLLPAMKAHGVPWFIKHLEGEITSESAVEKAKLDTRHYAKRQFTWFRHQLADWGRVTPETALDTLLRRAGR